MHIYIYIIYIYMLHVVTIIKLHIQLDIKICCNLTWCQDAGLHLSSCTCTLIWLHGKLVYIMCVVRSANLPALHPAIRHACTLYHECMYHVIVCTICDTICGVCSLLTIMPHASHAVQCCRQPPGHRSQANPSRFKTVPVVMVCAPPPPTVNCLLPRADLPNDIETYWKYVRCGSFAMAS